MFDLVLGHKRLIVRTYLPISISAIWYTLKYKLYAIWNICEHVACAWKHKRYIFKHFYFTYTYIKCSPKHDGGLIFLYGIYDTSICLSISKCHHMCYSYVHTLNMLIMVQRKFYWNFFFALCWTCNFLGKHSQGQFRLFSFRIICSDCTIPKICTSLWFIYVVDILLSVYTSHISVHFIYSRGGFETIAFRSLVRPLSVLNCQ